jgi:hypothetical protein
LCCVLCWVPGFDLTVALALVLAVGSSSIWFSSPGASRCSELVAHPRRRRPLIFMFRFVAGVSVSRSHVPIDFSVCSSPGRI